MQRRGVPWTVAFAPMAVMAPKVPTMKYWKSLGPVSPPAFLYFLNEGMAVVSLRSPRPRNGLEVFGATSALPRFCMAATELRRVGTCCLAHCLAIEAVAEERRDMAIVDEREIPGLAMLMCCVPVSERYNVVGKDKNLAKASCGKSREMPQ